LRKQCKATILMLAHKLGRSVATKIRGLLELTRSSRMSVPSEANIVS
jgi:hypothetical protein